MDNQSALVKVGHRSRTAAPLLSLSGRLVTVVIQGWVEQVVVVVVLIVQVVGGTIGCPV